MPTSQAPSGIAVFVTKVISSGMSTSQAPSGAAVFVTKVIGSWMPTSQAPSGVAVFVPKLIGSGMPTSQTPSGVAVFIAKVISSGMPTSQTPSGVAVFVIEVISLWRMFLVSFPGVPPWIIDFPLIKSNLSLQIIAFTCFSFDFFWIGRSLAASEGGFAVGVLSVEARLLWFNLLLVIVVLDSLWSLLVLLILLLGDLSLRFPVDSGFSWCRGFWPIVLSVVLSFVALHVLIAWLVVVGLLEVAWLLKMRRLLVGGLLVNGLHEISRDWMLRLHLRGRLVVSVGSVIVATKFVLTKRVKKIAIRIYKRTIRVNVKASCIVDSTGRISRRASTWTS